MLLVIVITLNTMLYLYHLQIFSGLTEVYGARRRWMWLWFLFLTRWIPMEERYIAAFGIREKADLILPAQAQPGGW